MATEHTIIYAEDDLDDLFIVQQAFGDLNKSVDILHCENGYKVMETLNRLQPGDARPCLIILDINMPGMDGRETLARIKQSEQWKDIPVVMFTTSSNRMDIEFAKKWGADFITKPLVFDELKELSKKFLDLCNFELSKRA